MQLSRYTLAAVVALAACDETIPAGAPIGGAVDTDAALQRYVRRAHLDLGGAPPADADLAREAAQLREAGNTTAARAALVDELMAREAFATVWIEELESSIFGGNTLEPQYGLLCALVRAIDTNGCGSCTAADSCECTCASVQYYVAERDDLRTTAADLRAGGKTSSIERRYAAKSGYFVLAGSVEGRVRSLFDDFLARTAEPDEIENGRAMIGGTIIPGTPAGLLFHRHGASYDDLLDIVFDSEIYREAIVRRVFDRYLARSPRANELAHFLSTLDANEPDARAVLRAVATSREYFDQ